MNLLNDRNSVAKKQDKKLGAFAEVFIPSVLTILGIIQFMRLGYVVGAVDTLLANDIQYSIFHFCIDV